MSKKTLTEIVKGDKVIMKSFTGMKLGVFEVTKVTKKSITIETRKGAMTFSLSTGKQVEPEPSAEKYANSIIPDDGSYTPPTRKKAKKQEPVKEPEVQDEPDDIDEDEEEMAAAKTKKSSKNPSKKPSKKKAAPEPEPEDDEDDEIEEDNDDKIEDDEDDEFEEVD